ncbi:MAG: hypothetical protein ACKVQS_10180 [Fimbriimonadaceae bacterium]
MLKPILSTTLLALTFAAHAQISLPKPQIPIPGLDNLLKGEAPLSTTIKDAKIWGWPNLAQVNLSNPTILTDADRDDNNLFTLKPGHYKMTIKSFCGKGYTYGPTQGEGYVWGPWKGSKAKFLQTLLKAYNAKPEVPQQNVQLLIWSILARVKPQDMSNEAKSALLALVGQDGMNVLKDGAADYLTGRMADELYKRASKELRPLLEYDNKIRGLSQQANASYEEFERLSVLQAPENLKSEIARGVWNISPKGYMIRYQPHGYNKTDVEVIVPRIAQFTRDSIRRVTQVSWDDGMKIEIAYSDKPAQLISGESDLKVNFVSQVKITMPGSSEPIVSTKEDYVLTGIPKKKKADLSLKTLQLRLFSATPFQDWMGRVERARDLHDRIETYQEWYERTQRIERGDEPSEGVFDSNHISDLIDSLFGGSDDRLEQIGETHGRLAEHLSHATTLLDSLPTTSTVDPGEGIATPGAGGHQLILNSTNSW